MSSFTSDLIISPLKDGKNWQLVNAFTYAVGAEDAEDVINVPAGFVTDFASVPRIMWSVIPPWGCYGKGSILHDYLYRVGAIVGNRRYTRKESDLIFLEAMEVLEVSKLKRKVIYIAVRMFGGSAYIN